VAAATCDVIVVGGGIVGASCAFGLRREGLSVLLLDRGEPERAASWGNAGHFAYEQIFPLATPELWAQLPRLLFSRDSPLSLPPRHLIAQAAWLRRFAWNTRPAQVRRARAALATLLHAAPGAWRRLAEGAGLEPLIRRSPALVVAQDAAALEAKRPAMKALREHGIASEELNPSQAREIEPMLRTDIAGAFVYPGAQYTVDPAALVRALVAALVAAGGATANDAIRSIDVSGAGVTVAGSKRTWTARQCVVAAGIGSRDILRSLSIDVPLAAERGYHLMVPLIEGKPRPRVPLIGARPQFVITPMAQGTRLAGTVEVAPAEAPPAWKRALMLKALSERIIEPLDGVASATMWMGCRPTLPDSLPIIGSMPGLPAVIAAFGHQHLGLTLSAITAEVVVALVRKRPPPVEITPYAATRF
jgi:D-hydroxyproline dehydrogenase